MINDIVINNIVTVRTFVVSRFICSVESIFPIDSDGKHKTSPATTTFQHNPNVVSIELTKNGRQFSISMFIILLILDTRYILAMKSILLFTVFNPFCTEVVIIGKFIKTATKTGKKLELNQNSATKIIATTGVMRIICNGILIKSLKNLKYASRAPRIVPIVTDIIKNQIKIFKLNGKNDQDVTISVLKVPYVNKTEVLKILELTLGYCPEILFYQEVTILKQSTMMITFHFCF